MKKYCEVCGKETDTRIIEKPEKYQVINDMIEVTARVMVCAECGEEFFCEELDEETLQKAYGMYRKKHRLLQPSEIRALREQYGLSQRGFARILNWGDKTIRRYENGAIQDKAHNSLLLLIKDPANMRKYLEENEIDITSRQKERLLDRVNEIEKEERKTRGEYELEFYLRKAPCEENGFKSFDYRKFKEMVLFFTARFEKLPKTQLSRLLGYADIMFYRENGTSISGTEYIRQPYGPAPKNYDLLLWMIEAEQAIRIEVEVRDDYECTRIIPCNEKAESILEPAESDMLEKTGENFKKDDNTVIQALSCAIAEKICMGGALSYKFAEDLPVYL